MLKRAFQLSLVISLLVHVFTFMGVVLLSKQQPPKSQIIEVEFIKPQAEKLIAQKLNEKPEKIKQIVDQNEKAVNDEVDKKAKFLSRNNQKVIKQTVAQKRGEFANANGAGDKKGSGADVLKKFIPQLDIGKAILQKQSQEMEFDKEATERAKQQAKNPKPIDTKKGEAGSQASQTLDYIKELEPGLETMLSTKEFVYFSFYSRVRGQLQQHWNTMVRERLSQMYKQGRTIASADDKITKVLVTLDPKGILVKVQIIGDSGVTDLDEAAVDAFRKAAPFPNPPTGMIDEDGTIKIRWDFILEASLHRPDAPHLDSENVVMLG